MGQASAMGTESSVSAFEVAAEVQAFHSPASEMAVLMGSAGVITGRVLAISLRVAPDLARATSIRRLWAHSPAVAGYVTI